MRTLVPIAAAATLIAVSAAHAPATPKELFRDASVRQSRVADVTWHGGPITAGSGEQVTVFVSDSYASHADAQQRWADFFTRLIHGSELGSLNAYIATPAEVASLCGGDEALGCYGRGMLVIPDEVVDDVSPDEIARHEYGHHVAASRSNAPWLALDWGPKRWASQAGVCARTSGGTAYPGDEGRHYTLNPGEAFAETYRVLNDVRGFGASVDWPLVDDSFRPDAAALDAVEQDVRDPWAGPTTTVLRGRFSVRARAWTLPLASPLDGSLTIELTYPVGARYGVELRGGGRVLARGTPSGARSARLELLLCGQRAETIRVTRTGAGGPFTLRIVRP
jgi:hypothetical protein